MNEKCTLWHSEESRFINGQLYPVCWGTKEKEPCSCGGNKEKCDFYPRIEKKAIINDLPTLVREKKRMCNSFDKCETCDFFQAIEKIRNDNYMDCWDFLESYPEQGIEIISEWAIHHQKKPTWKETLFKYFEEYNTNDSLTFDEWLNTEIDETQAKLFNLKFNNKTS